MKELIKKKRVYFPLIFIGQFALTLIIAHIFGLETQNSVLSAIYFVALVATITWLILKIIKDHRAKLSQIEIPIFGVSVVTGLYFIMTLIILIFVINLIVFLVGVSY